MCAYTLLIWHYYYLMQENDTLFPQSMISANSEETVFHVSVFHHFPQKFNTTEIPF